MRTFRAQLHALWSIPSARWLVVVVGVVAVGYTALASNSIPTPDNGGWAVAGLGFSAVVFAVLTAVSTAGGWATGAIQAELAAVPRRDRLFLGKAAAIAVSGFTLGTVLAILADAVAGFTPEGARVVLTGGLVMAAFGLFGFGVAALLRRTGLTVVAVLLLCLVLPPFSLNMRLFDLDAATLTLTQGSSFVMGGARDQVASTVGIALWALLPAAAAFLRFRSTDA